jgi:hypothetical protein
MRPDEYEAAVHAIEAQKRDAEAAELAAEAGAGLTRSFDADRR